jgi:hypothetical protein
MIANNDRAHWQSSSATTATDHLPTCITRSLALEHFEQCRANESEWRERARKELNFLNGEHWDAAMKAERRQR